MRIKLNLKEMTPVRSPAVYWLYVNINDILFIKQLKEKVQKVLKESRDIELCLDNVPFLDEDDIYAIHENEEITVTVNGRYNFTKPNKDLTESYEYNIPDPCDKGGRVADTRKNRDGTNGIISVDNIEFKNANLNDSSTSSILPKSSRKRVRKRTHKKNTHQLEPVTPDQNNYLGVETETSIITPKEPSKIHKRFKLNNEENGQHDSDHSSSDDESLYVKREVFRCNSSQSNSQKKQNTVKTWKEENPSKTKRNKLNNVPVFIRGQKLTSQNFIQNDNNKTNESDNEDCEMLVVDWKNMSPIKITNISELQLYDLIQFKTLSMNECGEPEMSSVITARLEGIDVNSLTLGIQVLSGVKEFMKLDPKFKINEKEDNDGEHEVQYEDLYDIYKLV